MLFATADSSFAGTIDLTSILTNPSFEQPSSGCPTGWECSGSPGAGFQVYTPTASQYTPGNDGLPSGTVPDGNQVIYGPDGLAGSAIIEQTTDTQWIAGDTYSYTFWVGTPYTEPDGITPVFQAPSGALRLYFLADGVQAGLPAYDITPPPVGQWEQVTYTVTPDQLWQSGATGLDVGVMLFASTGNAYEAVNFDADPPPSAPEPGTFGLMLATCAAALAVIRFRGASRERYRCLVEAVLRRR